MHARSKRRSLRRLRHGRDHPRSAGRAPNRQTPMARDRGPELGKLDHLMLADGLGGKSAGQAGAAAKGLVGPVIDEAIGLLPPLGLPPHFAAVTLVTPLCPAPPGVFPAPPSGRRRGPWRSARRL